MLDFLIGFGVGFAVTFGTSARLLWLLWQRNRDEQWKVDVSDLKRRMANARPGEIAFQYQVWEYRKVQAAFDEVLRDVPQVTAETYNELQRIAGGKK